MSQKHYQTQVKEGHYNNDIYVSPARWSTYALIVNEVMKLKPKSILEIGPGPGIVTTTLRKIGFPVKTADIDPEVNPDYLVSVTDNELSSKVGKQDLIIASEIFEHIEYKDFFRALKVLYSITNTLILTLPDTNEKALCFGIRIRIPLFNKISFFWKLRFGYVQHQFNGEHYWEIGKKHFPKKRITKDIEKTGWSISKSYINIDNPYHRFFILEKKQN